MKKLNIILCSIIILTLVITTISLNILDDTIPIHFNMAGEPDLYGSKYFVLIFTSIVIILAVIFLVLANSKKITDSYKKNLKVISPLICVIFIIIEVIFVVYAYSYNESEYLSFDFGKYITLFIGIMAIVIGNILPKIEKNKTLGIRTKHSLYNEVTWFKTQRFGGYAICIYGFVLLITAVFFESLICYIVLVSTLILTIFIVSIYSYKVYKIEKLKKIIE